MLNSVLTLVSIYLNVFSLLGCPDCPAPLVPLEDKPSTGRRVGFAPSSLLFLPGTDCGPGSGEGGQVSSPYWLGTMMLLCSPQHSTTVAGLQVRAQSWEEARQEWAAHVGAAG